MGAPEFAEWRRYAQDDLDAALFLLTMPQRKLEIICYHSHQCVEKAIKSALAFYDMEIPRTHDLRVLSAILEAKLTIANYQPALAYLQPFAVAVRYPFQLEIESGDEEMAVKVATEFLDYITKAVSRI
jgi:HEPN domain-containing protein